MGIDIVLLNIPFNFQFDRFIVYVDVPGWRRANTKIFNQ